MPPNKFSWKLCQKRFHFRLRTKSCKTKRSDNLTGANPTEAIPTNLPSCLRLPIANDSFNKPKLS